MGMTLSLIARKGGVGKTSTALNLAGAGLDDGLQQVLLIDMDSQASLSKAVLGPATVDALRPDQTVQAVAERTRSAGDVVRETAIPGLLIVPAHHDLRVPPDGALNLAGVNPDLVLIDTPPDTRDAAVRCAMLASNVVVSPVVPEGWGLQSVHGVQQLLMSAGLISNQQMVFAGWLISMVQRIAMHTVCSDTLRRLHGATVFDVTLPHAAAFKEAAAAGVPITQQSPKSAAARAVRAVWNETLDRVEAAAQRGAA